MTPLGERRSSAVFLEEEPRQAEYDPITICKCENIVVDFWIVGQEQQYGQVECTGEEVAPVGVRSGDTRQTITFKHLSLLVLFHRNLPGVESPPGFLRLWSVACESGKDGGVKHERDAVGDVRDNVKCHGGDPLRWQPNRNEAELRCPAEHSGGDENVLVPYTVVGSRADGGEQRSHKCECNPVGDQDNG